MKKNNPALISFLVVIVTIVFGLSNTESNQFEELLTELLPSPTPLAQKFVQGDQTQRTEFVPAQVTRVVDGDTIKVSLGGVEKTVRLIGINTPETVDPRREVECFGLEASAFAKETLQNKTVYLESDETQGDADKYQRLLRYVWLDDQTNFNKLLVFEGYAYEYTYDLPYKYQQEFIAAQQEAERNNRGLWSDGTCNGSK